MTGASLPVPVAATEQLPADVRARIGLRGRRQLFVEHFLLCSVAQTAAQRAGYTGTGIRRTAHRLLHSPSVAAAIELGRKALAERANFTFDRAMNQLRDDRTFAIETKNATAAVRASELMTRMSGHLIDKVDMRVQQIPLRIIIAGIEEQPPIEAEQVAHG